MKLVIDIPEEMIEAAKNDMWCGSPTVGDAIKHGTPYEERPKGKWEEHVERKNLNTRKCTSCGEYGAVGYFCMWCGADMMREGGKP